MLNTLSRSGGNIPPVAPIAEHPERPALQDHPYNCALYAGAFGDGFEPIYLEEARTFVLKRAIEGTSCYDAIGGYPLSPLSAGGDLEKDFGMLKRRDIVSVVLITGPFFAPATALLEHFFTVAAPFKRHYLYDFGKTSRMSKNHTYKIRRALKVMDVRKIELSDYLEEWMALYATLIDKRGITGMQAFSPEYFLAISRMQPVMFGAFIDNVLVSAQLWFAFDGYIYSHLVASNEAGYRHRAAYAVYDEGLRYFARRGAKMATLGGVAGNADAENGLYAFKQGFSNATGMSYLCGKILDEARYARLSRGKNTEFFPAYRG